MPLRIMMGTCAFPKWGIYFVGPINPPTHKNWAQYTIVVTNYIAKWVEEKAKPKKDAWTTV